jgi:serine/threonine protein kinase
LPAPPPEQRLQETAPHQNEEQGSDDATWPIVPGYQIVGILGRGGMGIVYKAWQRGLDRPVALKMIRSDAVEPDSLARFQAEYRHLARLQHPNIVTIYEVGEAAGRPFFVMELLEVNLEQTLRHRPQPARPSARLVASLARTLHVIHRQGIIHRDLKPANILLRPRTEGAPAHEPPDDCPLSAFVPRISDFGLARNLAHDDGPTRPGTILGTPCYLAPEQAEGHSHAVTPATDIYALGVILYEMLTGRPPLLGENLLDTLEQVRSGEPIPPTRLVPGLPRDLDTIILKCLRKEPQQRYAGALDLANDLERFLADQPIQARGSPVWERAIRRIRRRPAVTLLSLALGLALLALVGLGLCSHLHAQCNRAEMNESPTEAQDDVRRTCQSEEIRKAREEEQRQRERAEQKTRQRADLPGSRLGIQGTTVSRNSRLDR